MTAPPTDLRGLAGVAPSTSSSPTTTVTPPPSRWKTRVLVPGAIATITLLLLAVTSHEALRPATPVRVVPVVVRTVEADAGTVTVQAPGWLEPDPHPHYVTALADGVVGQVLVLEGDAVQPGQVVAQLIDDDARLALRRAEADLDGRRADLATAEADGVAARLQLEHLVESSRRLAVAEARVAEAAAAVEKIEADAAVERARLLELTDEHDRKSQLVASQAVSEAIVARLGLRVEAQRATVAATTAQAGVLAAQARQTQAERDAAATGHRLLIDERRAAARAEAATARARADVAFAEAVRDEAALRLTRMTVRTSVGGIVLRRLVTPGSTVNRGGAEHAAHVVHLYDPASLQVRVDVPLADAAHVAVDQRAEITVEVLPDRVFAGRVTRLGHEADIQKNTVEVKVAIDDPSRDLKPEMLARVRFLAATPDRAANPRQRVFAPETLVRRDASGAMTTLVVTRLVDGRGRLEARVVTAGRQRFEGWMEIDGGLRAGDLLVADPPADLGPGDRVEVVDGGG